MLCTLTVHSCPSSWFLATGEVARDSHYATGCRVIGHIGCGTGHDLGSGGTSMSMRTEPGDRVRLGEEQFRLAKSLGVLAIGASALTHEYGATINYVSTNSLSIYP